MCLVVVEISAQLSVLPAPTGTGICNMHSQALRGKDKRMKIPMEKKKKGQKKKRRKPPPYNRHYLDSEPGEQEHAGKERSKERGARVREHPGAHVCSHTSWFPE